jgi:hypothetical protein
MSKDKTTKAVEVSNEAPAINQEVSNILDKLEEGLESSDDVPAELILPHYSDRKWLETNEAIFPAELTSKKFDAEREPKVQAGLKAIAELMPDKINPLVLLLGKFWENKPARAAIKNMLDAEAASLNIPSDVYLQLNLRKNIDTLSTIQQAVDRMKYAITYFKPRAGVSTKEVYKVMTIDGEMYNVSLNALELARPLFGEDKVALKAHLKEISVKLEIDEIL